MSLEETYARLAAGDPGAVGNFFGRQSPRLAALAAAARKVRAAAPQVASAPRAPASIAASAIAPAAAPRPSRAAEIAEIHSAGINESRRRCGLPPVDAATLATEFSDVDRLPAARSKLTRREAGNLAARQLGAPVDQTSIDSIWTGIVGRLNATLASSSRTPSPGSASRAPQSQASIDDMWSSLAADLNKKAGIARTPVGDRAR